MIKLFKKRNEDKILTDEELYKEIEKLVIEEQKASASYIQRHFRIGYNRACYMVKLLEENGIVGHLIDPSIPREVLVSKKDL